MPQSIPHVQPRLKFIPPAFSPWLLRAVYAGLPILLRLRLWPWLPAGISQIKVINAVPLTKLYHQFQQGKIRLLMAFRHVEVDDPLCGLYLLSRTIPRVAQQEGISLRTPLHAHFLYDRGMTIWAGDWLGWGLSHLGGIPIRRGRQPDWQALRQARTLLRTGDLPMVIAPEGATNGHSERVGPLESGTAQLSFWCVEDLVKAGQDVAVWVVPISIQYHYVKPDWLRLQRLLSRLEQESGLSTQVVATATPEQTTQRRILHLGEHLLSKMGAFYQRFYHQTVLSLDPSADHCDDRLQTLLEAALQVAEQYFGIVARGNRAERCRRIEEAGWTYIYRDDLDDRAQLSTLDRGLADWVAQEASLRMLHMRLVETLVAVSDRYLKEKPSFERCAETTLLMFDLLARLRGDKLPGRPRLGDRQAVLTVGEPISVSDRYASYRSSSSAPRQAVADLTRDLQHALEQMIT